MTRPRHLGLQWKLTMALVLIVLLPLVASAILIDSIGKYAANFGATEAKERAAMIEQVSRVYRDLVVTTKALQAEIRALKDRIQVLERIATDNNRAVTLDQEIEKLRDSSKI